MPLDKKAINEVKNIYFDEYNEELSDQEALDVGISLINLMKIIFWGHKSD